MPTPRNLETITADSLKTQITAVLDRDPVIERRLHAHDDSRRLGSAIPLVSTVDASALRDIPDDIEFIRQAHLALVARQPDPLEVSAIQQQLSTFARAFVLEQLVDQALAANPQLAVHGRWPRRTVAELAALSGPDLIREAFRTILWREPANDEYVRYLWAIDRLGSPKAFLTELSNVPEAQRYPRLEDLFIELSALESEPEETFVTRAYRTILAREPDPEGLRATKSALRWISRRRIAKAIARSARSTRPPRRFSLARQPDRCCAGSGASKEISGRCR